MPLTFKITFEKIDFKDNEYVNDLMSIYNFYNDGIDLEYKLNKEKKVKNFISFSDLMQFMEDEENNNIQYGNLIFSNYVIPQLKQKFKERNL